MIFLIIVYDDICIVYNIRGYFQNLEIEVILMSNKYEEMIREEWEKFSSEQKLLPNIMLLGATGCGKSSLINTIFKKDNLAEVNDVYRGTEGFKTYYGKDYDIGVNLIDSRGYEMEDGSGESFLNYQKSIQNKMEENRSKKPLEKIHIIWYCISIASERIQPYDIEILKMLQKQTDVNNKIAVILTKCDEDYEDRRTFKCFKNIIHNDVSHSISIFGVSIYPELPLELEEMMNWSADKIDNADLKEAFIASQVISLDAKRKIASERIFGYAAAAAGAAGFNPFPVSDAAILTPLQITMSTHIIKIYGMENYASISEAVIGNIFISNLGKSLAGGLLKLIPVIGTITGGIINAGVASLITSALGFAISEICYDSCKKILNGEYVDMSSIFDIGSIQKYFEQYINKHKDDK